MKPHTVMFVSICLVPKTGFETDLQIKLANFSDFLSKNGQDNFCVRDIGKNINMSILHSISIYADKYQKHIELFGVYNLIIL